MNTTLAPKYPTSTQLPGTSPTMLARKSAIVTGLLLSMTVSALITFLPELMNSAALWAVWVLAMTGVIAAYISGHVTRRKMSGRLSRRTRRWITAHQN